MSFRGLAVAFALTGTACAGIPDLTFAPDDASILGEGGQGGGDSGASIGSDSGGNGSDSGGTTDSGSTSTDAGQDSGSSATCGGGGVPAGATTCCGSTPCVDHQGQGCVCGDCTQMNCGSKWCCFDSQGNLSCKPNASACK